MKIAITGCGHCELDKIYAAIEELERRHNFKVGLLLNCGDFQAVRNPSDLESVAVPPKFRKMNTFYKYYSGECVAAILTIFIGGNHEASNFLAELPYGGWVQVLRARIHWTVGDFRLNRSVNGRLIGLEKIECPYGWLKFLAHEDSTSFVCTACSEKMSKIRKTIPCFWCPLSSTTKFLALDKCLPRRSFLQILDFDTGLEDESLSSASDFAEKLEYDPEWLAILKSTDDLLNLTPEIVYMPSSASCGDERHDFRPTKVELEEIASLLQSDFRVPSNFSPTAPAYNPKNKDFDSRRYKTQPQLCVNPQTTLLCNKLGIRNWNKIMAGECCNNADVEHLMKLPASSSSKRPAFSLPLPSQTTDSSNILFCIDTNPDEIPLDDDSEQTDAEQLHEIADNQQYIALKDEKCCRTEQMSDCAEIHAERSQNIMECGPSFVEDTTNDILSKPIKLPMKRRNADIYRTSVE